MNEKGIKIEREKGIYIKEEVPRYRRMEGLCQQIRSRRPLTNGEIEQIYGEKNHGCGLVVFVCAKRRTLLQNLHLYYQTRFLTHVLFFFFFF